MAMPAAVRPPQKWKNRHWPYPGEDGVYVQLQSSNINKLWFIRVEGTSQPRWGPAWHGMRDRRAYGADLRLAPTSGHLAAPPLQP